MVINFNAQNIVLFHAVIYYVQTLWHGKNYNKYDLISDPIIILRLTLGSFGMKSVFEILHSLEIRIFYSV